MSSAESCCIFCRQTSYQVPLLALSYQGKQYWICSQHLPVLIHEPQQLAGVLPGVDQMGGADHHADCGHE